MANGWAGWSGAQSKKDQGISLRQLMEEAYRLSSEITPKLKEYF